MEYQKVPSSILSKKLTDCRSFGGKSMYDGVFAAPLKVGSRVKEDYSEIFCGSGGSSIPILDIPELNEGKVSVDVRSSKLDYSIIFGGFGEFDSAVSHEELFAKPRKKDSRDEKARTPSEAGSTSNLQVENQEFSHSPSYQSFDGAKQFKMSYLKTNLGSKHGTNGTTHIAQLNAIPGYTCLIDEVAPSQFNGAKKPSSSGLSDTFLDINLSDGNMGNIKAESTLSPGNAIKQAHRGDSKLRSKTKRNRSNSKETLSDVFDVDFGTLPSKSKPPSRQPCNLPSDKDDLERSMAPNAGVSRRHSIEDAAGFSSPQFPDEDIDTNSVAATSAAAVKKAIEDAQARIRMAKGIMERKKKGFENYEKPRYKASREEERTDCKIVNKANAYSEETGKKFRKVGHTMPVHTMLGVDYVISPEQMAPDLSKREEIFSIKEASGGMTAEHNSTQVDHRLEEVKDREAERWKDIGTEAVRSIYESGPEEKYISKETFERPEENMKAIDAVENCDKQEAKWTFNFNAMRGARWLSECDHVTKPDQQIPDQKEYENNVRILEETNTVLKASQEEEGAKTELEGVQEISADGEKLEVQDYRDNGRMEMIFGKEERGCFANEKKQEGAPEEEVYDISDGVSHRKENEVGKEEISYQEENGEREEEAVRTVVSNEEQQKETCWKEETEERLEDIHKTVASEKTSGKEQAQEKDEVTVEDFCEEKIEENVEAGIEKIKDIEETEKIHKGTCQIKATEKREEESDECMEAQKISTGIDQIPKDQDTVSNQDSCEDISNYSEVADDVCRLDQFKTPSETLETSGDEECEEYLDAPTDEESEETTVTSQASFHSQEMETESIDVADWLEEKEIFEAEIASLAQEFLEVGEIKRQVDNTVGTLAIEPNEISLGYTDMDLLPKQYEQHADESKSFCNQEEHADNFVCESEEKLKDVDDSKGAFKQGDDEHDPKFSHGERSDNGEIMEETPVPPMSVGEEETAEIAHKDERSPNSKENEETHHEPPMTQECGAKFSLQNELETEREEVRKVDEAKEKEREREKERMAVERAIREARERAFAEARERAAAEKANAEARRRAMAEARGRSDKASAEANDKASVDKASVEARLKAERAAVERATAEARKRALEKAISEKARNQGVKLSGASRDTGTRQNSTSTDSRSKGSAATHNSSTHCVNAESVKRHKARLERHQRTAEQAAKALAEKNMRDLLAQKEQQERNRLAEALDADVKRWSSGKEGNLRALLSTLQYVLGPDSGWQPIPLTELIASAAVKKAYRRATLYVHPDKLQQRGATIQQKYTCEKVFDLLKEAYNKFSKEER